MRKNKLTFYTIFQISKNIHLIKDVGMIPFVMYKYYNYNSFLCTYKNDEYSFLREEVKGLKVIFCSENSLTNNDLLKIKLSVVKFLLKNAKNIDILHLMHLSKASLFYTLVYKIFNKKGIVYIKSDYDPKKHSIFKTGKKYKKVFKFFIYKIFDKLKFIDIISAETKEGLKDLSLIFKEEKLVYIPNGFLKPSWIDKLNFNKENVILTVGRLGTEEKATEILMEAFAKIKEYKDWKLILVGPIQKDFEEYINNFFKKYSHLKTKILFTGEIKDRKELFEYYKKAKIFVMPSRWESFGIAMLEAAWSGCYLVSTDVGAIRDILEITNYGTIIEKDNIEQLSKVLQNLILNWESYEKDPIIINKLIDENFNWIKICKKLDQKIKSLLR